jgi:hypothetical protein
VIYALSLFVECHAGRNRLPASHGACLNASSVIAPLPDCRRPLPVMMGEPLPPGWIEIRTVRVARAGAGGLEQGRICHRGAASVSATPSAQAPVVEDQV